MGVAGIKWPMPTHFVFIFHKTWSGRFAESFTQKFSSVSKLPIFQKRCFFKNGPKNVTKVEKFIFFSILSNHFIGLFNGILHVLILRVVSEKQGFRFLRNGVYINLLQNVRKFSLPYQTRVHPLVTIIDASMTCRKSAYKIVVI